MNQDILGVSVVDSHSVSTGWVEFVASDGHTLSFIRGVEPNICDFTAVVEDVVGDGHVVGTDLTALMAVVVRGTFYHNTNATVDERVAVNDVSISAVHLHADVVVIDGVVQRRVSVIVNERAVGDSEEVQFVAVVVSIAHCTDNGSNT